ncbi:Meiotically up-regulated gene 87 protein [Neolecta irregularis DAH-3]|uniref:Nuclear pore protein n=1 Tax=Neolecta irregularis (strain DAH-3) TaxID=1198029 RepID=A0A1U7LSP7_NEOID|nr:Meiotically up-regulated gene 87 protein [Neolecta irregularis DAH-3]|eukprot:OLL25638.1 Meiotically up-regulated gene 87 protein [Neolecta irregularis DAH-3]
MAATSAQLPVAGNPTASASASALDELLEQSKRLLYELKQPVLPQLHFSLEQIDVQAQSMANKAAQARDGDTKAHYLLANSGMNAEETAQVLRTIALQSTYDSGPPISDTDVDGYLRYRREQSIMAAMEQDMARRSREFDLFLEKNLNAEWEKQKQKFFEHFGFLKSTQDQQSSQQSLDKSVFGKSHFRKSTFGKSVFGRDDTFRQSQTQASSPNIHRQTRYGQVVKLLQIKRIEKKPMPVMSAFGEAIKSLGSDIKSQQLFDSWRILSSIVGESGVLNGQFTRDVIKERQFAIHYAAVSSESKEGVFVRTRITDGSRRYLENQFFAHVETEVARNPQDANIGGVPSIQNKALGYLKVRFYRNHTWENPNLEIVNNIPIWALLFYLFRSGYLTEAVQYAQTHESSIIRLERHFVSYLKAYATSSERRLPRQLRDRLHSEYSQRIRFTQDPFKTALYKIIGRCDLSKRNLGDVCPTTEDWMWLQLILCREASNDEISGEEFGLVNLQNTIMSFGAKHFNQKGNNPVIYFQLLLLCGLFERGVNYLLNWNNTDAVHFAVGLCYHGLLRVPSIKEVSEDSLLTTKPLKSGNEEAFINFARLLGSYIQEFMRAEPEMALDYICLICLNGDLPSPKGTEQRNLCHEMIRELALETREFSALLGDVKADGRKEIGAIQKRVKLIGLEDHADYLRTITEQAARQADLDGRTSDAVLLYHLSEDYDTVATIINKSLGDAINDPSSRLFQTPMLSNDTSIALAAEQSPAQLARNMMQVYSANARIYSRVSQVNRDACQTLLKMVEARTSFEAQQWENCLHILDALELIPLDKELNVGKVKKKVQLFSSLPEYIASNIPIMLSMAMNCLLAIHTQLKESPFGDVSRINKMGELRKMARCAMMFAGMIQYRMSSETFGELNRLDVMF